jgi:3-phenylpropionate/trans-cinnamate dioxygenase ferredoxin reductase subunit
MVESLAIVGASLAGTRTAEALRRHGFNGHLTIIGAEDESPYDRPPLSKQFLSDDWSEDKLALCRNGVEQLNAQWRLGIRASSLDSQTRTLLLDDGSSCQADAIVLATGMRARQLPFGRGLGGVLELRTLSDARLLRAAMTTATSIVIVGAGFIGMEVAASCRKRGLDVSVVEPLPAPLVRGLGPLLGERVATRHREEGVVFHLGEGVESFEGDTAVSSVRLTSGVRLPADIVLVGVGAVPDTQWLETSGLEMDNGILCDATGATSRAGIFAVGDCARWENARYPDRPRFEHWTSAVEQSEVVAQAIALGQVEAHAPVPYVWSDQFDLRVAIAGEHRPDDEMHVCLGTVEEGQFLALFERDGKLVSAVAFGRPRQLNASRRMIAEGVNFREAVAQFI